jgi:hypothetical protein
VPTTPPASPGIKRAITAAPVRPHPVADRVGRHRQQPRDLDLRPPAPNQHDRPPPKLHLSRLRQRTGIPIHTRNPTTNTNYLLRQISKSTEKQTLGPLCVLGQVRHAGTPCSTSSDS